MQAGKVNFFGVVPTMYFALLHTPEADDFDLNLKYCVSGGAGMPVEVMKAFDENYGVDILEGYGLSETSPVASFNVLDRPKKAGSIGPPLWGVEFRLEDDEGNVITEVGKHGEICIKGHNVMRCYYKRPEATAEAIIDGWFHTGDIGTVDDDGYYFIVDRKKDMIIRGGFNVSRERSKKSSTPSRPSQRRLSSVFRMSAKARASRRSSLSSLGPKRPRTNSSPTAKSTSPPTSTQERSSSKMHLRRAPRD